MRYLFLRIVITALTLLAVGISVAAELPAMSLAGAIVIYCLALAATSVLTIQRCHDFNLPGWFSILAIIPLLGLVFVVIPGTAGSNRFGDRTPPNSPALIVFGIALPLLAVAGLLFAAYRAPRAVQVDAAIDRYDTAWQFIVDEMREYKLETAKGHGTATLPTTADVWIDALNAAIVEPNGDAVGFVRAGDELSEEGTIGVSVSGTLSAGDLTVTLHRPGFTYLPATSDEVRLSERDI